jgi:hypothetical protein
MDPLKFETKRRQIEARVTSGEGTLPAADREALLGGAVKGPLAPLAEKLERYSHRITDEDFQALRAAGFSDAQLFEACVSSVLGSASRRCAAGLAAFDAFADAPDDSAGR